MFKTISAALLAVSVLAAPAFAAGSDKTAKAPAVKAAQVKPSALNANAKMGHHGKKARHHKKVSAVKTHAASTLAIKHTAPVAKRG